MAKTKTESEGKLKGHAANMNESPIKAEHGHAINAADTAGKITSGSLESVFGDDGEPYSAPNIQRGIGHQIGKK
jgi:hypothetical protein